MKKTFLIAVAAFGIGLMLTACGRGNMDTEVSDYIADVQDENQTNSQKEEKTEGETAESGKATVQTEQKESEDGSEAEETEKEETEKEETGGQAEMRMNVQIGDYSFMAVLEENAAVEELLDMMKEGPVTIQMEDYSGFEKVGSLGKSLTTSNSQTTTTAGDIVLYNGSNIVMFYGSNSWSYTRIGKIEDLTHWEEALGDGSITAVFTVEE